MNRNTEEKSRETIVIDSFHSSLSDNTYKNHWNSLNTIIHNRSPNTVDQKIVNSMYLSILITHGNLTSTEKKASTVVLNMLVERVENDRETATAVTDLSIKLRLTG